MEDARRAVLFPTVSHVYNSFPNYIPTTYVSNRCRSTHDVKKARLCLRARDYWPVTRMNYHTDTREA